MEQQKLRELSLFTGAGGGVLGTTLLGWQHLGYVEYDKYCQKVLRQRMQDGWIDKAPIFGDVRDFVNQGYANSYKGMVDVVSAGFPCQPFSVAGKRKASDDSRNMWPATLDVIKAIHPPFVFLENVPGLLSAKETYCSTCGEKDWEIEETSTTAICSTCKKTMDDSTERPFWYFGEILRDLAEEGYDAKWCVLGADDLGLLHRRKRVWILAVAQSERCGHKKRRTNNEHHGRPAAKKQKRNDETIQQGQKRQNRPGKASRIFTPRITPSKLNAEHSTSQSSNDCRPEFTIDKKQSKPKFRNTTKFAKIANPRSKRAQRIESKKIQRITPLSGCENIRKIEDLQGRSDIPEPLVRGMDNGMANRVDRIKAIGNGQVPGVVAAAWRLLNDLENE